MRAAGILLAACAASAASAQQQTLRVLALPESVDFGVPFEIVVERDWPADASPPRWSPEMLEPLRVETRSRALEELATPGGARVVEKRSLRAWAFAVGELSVGERALEVRGALDPAAPGAFEEPALPQPAPPVGVLLTRAVALLLLAAASVFLVATLRRRPRPLPALPDGVGLLRAWAAAPRLDDGGAALRAAMDAALLQRTGVDARARSGPELLVEPRVTLVLGAQGCAALAALREALDLGHYAGRAPSGWPAAGAPSVSEAGASSIGGSAADEPATHARALKVDLATQALALADALDARLAEREAAA